MKSIILKTLFLLALAFFIVSTCNNSSTPMKTVALQPYERFPQHLTDTIESTIKKVYGFHVVVLPPKPLPKNAFISVKSPRYRADTLIRILRREKPDSVDYVLGLTLKDISTTKRNKGEIKEPIYKYIDWGIMGLGFRPGVSCVLSTFRIKDKNTIERLTKITMHELGHNLGLKHCTFSNRCVMRDAAETVKTLEKVDLKLCSNCRVSIKHN